MGAVSYLYSSWILLKILHTLTGMGSAALAAAVPYQVNSSKGQ